jgi:1-phosphatidylinositol-4-phosphate 5-kinase
MHRTNTNNAIIQRNENEAIKSERTGNSDDEVESRQLSTMRSPSAERSGGLQGQILPVVEELGEASSTGGRSGVSRERDGRPLTPAKDNLSEDRPPTPMKDYSPSNGNGGIKKALSRSSLDKELPPIPGSKEPNSHLRVD